MKPSVVMVILISFLACSPQAVAQKPRLRVDQVRIVYAPPTEPKHQLTYETLRQRGLLELLRTLLSPFRLPRRLTLELKGCDGKVEAFYERDTATFCYEYVELIQQHAPAVGTPGGLIPADAVFAAIIETFLHEVGHAIFDMLRIPILGREEDAADFVSAYILLQFPPEDARRLVQGVGFLLASEAKALMKEAPKLRTYANEHGLPAQRYYNFLCMAYGSNPKIFANAVSRGRLPEERAQGCAEEYETLKRAFHKLIRPYVDQVRLRKARSEVRFNWSASVPLTDGVDAPPLRDFH